MCMFILFTRKRGHPVFAVLITALFIIATIGVAFQHAIVIQKSEQYLIWYTIGLEPFRNVPIEDIINPSGESQSENALFLKKLYELSSGSR